MPTTHPCRICGVLAQDDILRVTDGLCNDCAQYCKKCEVCEEFKSEFVDDSLGRCLCEECAFEEHKLKNKVQHLDLKSPLHAKWSSPRPGQIDHEILGLVFDDQGDWTSMPLQMGSLGYESHFGFWDGAPSERQLTTAVHILQSSGAFREEMAAKLAKVYTEEIRPAFLDDDADPEDLPELNSPEEVWNLIEELKVVCVENDTDVTFVFQPKFAPNHDLVVKILDDTFAEIMLDG